MTWRKRFCNQFAIKTKQGERGLHGQLSRDAAWSAVAKIIILEKGLEKMANNCMIENWS